MSYRKSSLNEMLQMIVFLDPARHGTVVLGGIFIILGGSRG